MVLMIDIVFAKDDKKGFLEMAKKLGYSDLCFAYNGEAKGTGLAAGFNDQNASLALAEFNGAVPRNADVIVGMEGKKIKNAFFSEAAEKNVLLALSFSAIINAKNRHKAINSVRYIIRAARKSKAHLLIASFAHDPFLMRSPLDTQGFFCCLGMNPGEAKKAMSAVHERIESNNKARKSGVAGIEIIE